MTDPSNNGKPEDKNVASEDEHDPDTEPVDDARDTETDGVDAAEETDDSDDSPLADEDDRDDDEDDDRAKDKPAATGKASRSGNPARAAEAEESSRRTRPVKPKRIGNRWAAPAMLTSAGIGLVWIVIYYVFANTENPVPVMKDLGDWNLIIGMGFIVAAFGFSMKWE